MRKARVDLLFLIVTILLVASGFFIFNSAALGLLNRGGATLRSVVFNQAILGLLGGSLAAFIISRINYKFWRKYAFYLFITSIFLTILVFVPGLGFSHGGATRWINLGFITFQPAEILKFSFIIYMAAWFSGIRQKSRTFGYGLLPVAIILTILGTILLAQPDTDTFIIMATTGISMYFISGAKWRHIFVLLLVGMLGIAMLATYKPYIKERVLTYLDPSRDAQGASYQVQQSLIAIGSGQFSGRGFGQSVQKFKFLPEPIGDSVFAVAAEEFGFLGAVGLVILFVFFALRGFKISIRAPDIFSRLLVSGIVILITIQAFVNIGAMLSILPLTGIPLPFVSHGGTSLFFTLAAVGIVLNISRYKRSLK